MIGHPQTCVYPDVCLGLAHVSDKDPLSGQRVWQIHNVSAPFALRIPWGGKGQIHCVSARPLVPREGLYQIHGQALNQRFRKGVGGRGLATNKPPNRAQKVLQKCVPILLRGHRKKGTEKRPKSLAFEGFLRANPLCPPKGAGGQGPRQKTSKIVKKCQKVFRHFSRRAKNVKNRQKVSKSFSTLFDNFRAAPFFRPPFAIR